MFFSGIFISHVSFKPIVGGLQIHLIDWILRFSFISIDM